MRSKTHKNCLHGLSPKSSYFFFAHSLRDGKNPFLCQWSFMLSSFLISMPAMSQTSQEEQDSFFFANLVTIRYFGVKKTRKRREGRREKSIKYKTTRNDELFTIFFPSILLFLFPCDVFFKNNLTFFSSSFFTHIKWDFVLIMTAWTLKRMCMDVHISLGIENLYFFFFCLAF